MSQARAAPAAGLAKLVAERTLSSDEAAVAVITGSGLKDPRHAAPA
ncbi:MAG TPA: hypothetical protein VKV26_15565 [Dehalococcoidia bacterium]|nr:hypothetical protein [Dehalococcoidia bacterium]